jgi:hypothetical protein
MIGTFSIRELTEHPTRFELWLDHERLRVFSSADAAVYAVFMRNTGCTQWDRRHVEEQRPSSLSQWTLESKADTRVREEENSEENQSK